MELRCIEFGPMPAMTWVKVRDFFPTAVLQDWL